MTSITKFFMEFFSWLSKWLAAANNNAFGKIFFHNRNQRHTVVFDEKIVKLNKFVM